jgi:hypothetical protein
VPDFKTKKSAGGNPTIDNLAAIFDAVSGALRVRLEVNVVRAVAAR